MTKYVDPGPYLTWQNDSEKCTY